MFKNPLPKQGRALLCAQQHLPAQKPQDMTALLILRASILEPIGPDSALGLTISRFDSKQNEVAD